MELRERLQRIAEWTTECEWVCGCGGDAHHESDGAHVGVHDHLPYPGDAPKCDGTGRVPLIAGLRRRMVDGSAPFGVPEERRDDRACWNCWALPYEDADGPAVCPVCQGRGWLLASDAEALVALADYAAQLYDIRIRVAKEHGYSVELWPEVGWNPPYFPDEGNTILKALVSAVERSNEAEREQV